MAMTIWTREEEARLVQELRDGLTAEDIAGAHQRTPSAVLARIARMTPHDLNLRTRAQRAQWLREQLLADPGYDWAAPLEATRRRQHDRTRAQAPRTGAVWSPAEDAQVLAAAATDLSNAELAAQLQRSARSTARRAWQLTQGGQTSQEDPTVFGDGDGDGDLANSRSTSATGVPTQAPKPSEPSQAPNTDTGRAARGATSNTSRSTTASGPSAHGQPWTEDETFQLLEELRRGLSTEDVAAAHHRSVRAINGRAATVLTHLTGTKHALNDSSADQLRTRLTQDTGATSSTATSCADHSAQDALDVLRAVLGATTVDA